MIFKRSNGEFRETDRVTRFKLIKSGKNWLRAATSNFGLLKVIRGQVEETVVAEVREDAVSAKSRHLLKGIVVAAAVLSATTVANTTFADEVGNEVVSSSTAVSAPSVSTEAASLTEEASKEVSAPQNETATETKPSVASSSEVVESAVASDDKAILEQNASEAALLNQIAEKYASTHQNEEQKAAIKEAVAKVQAELPTKEASSNSEVKPQSYAEQRERLNKSVDDMMVTLKAAGFKGNTTVNGAPAVSAQLDALSTSTTLTAPSVSPIMDEPNGASIEDPAWNNANYQLDPNADRYTYSIWDLQNWQGAANQGGVTYNNGGYYVTFSVDRSTVGTTKTPTVHARLVEKATGKEVEALDMTANSTFQFSTLVKENPTYAPQFDYTTGESSQILGTWTNNREAGPTSDDKYKHHILQIRDTVKPGNVGETKPNVQTVIPIEKVTHTTHYKVEGTNEELASYSQTGIESQDYKASNPRSFEGYEFVRTDAEKDMAGSLGGVGAKYLELQGGRAHYYVKRIVEQVDKDGTSVVKLYALDPSKVASYNPSTDVNTLDLTNYTLLYTSDPVKPGGKPTPAGTATEPKEVGYVDSKDGKYHLKVATYTDGGNGNVRLSGWYNKATGDAFTDSPQFSADVDPVRNNTSNIIGGNTPGDKASGYPSFFNNYSLPSIKEISTDVTHYYRKTDEKGNVFVHYKDTEGNTIKDSVKDEDQQPVNKHYDTVEDNRPQTIEKAGKTYELVPAGNYTVGEVDDQGHLKSSDPTTGEVAKEDKNITYIYKLKEEPKGNVYVHYVDTEGKTIKSDVTDEDAQPVDKDYDTVVDNRPQEIEFEGKTYELVAAGNYTVGEVDDQGHLKSTDPTTGKVIEGDKNVTYVYKQKEEPKGNVYVHYVDTEGKTIKSDVTDEEAQPVDKDYDTVVDNRPQEIEFEGKTYELVPAGNYKVGEVDDQGHLKSTDPTTGKVIEGDKNVTYVYKQKEEPKGNVYVHYVDTEGKTIKSDVTDEEAQPVDKDYDTVVDNRPQEIEFEGKTYELVPSGNYTVGEVDDQGHLKSTDPTTGKVIEGDKNVTYVYKLKETPAEPKGNVYVHYVDTEGKTIKSDVTDEEAQPVDKDYDTVVDNRPQEIEFEGKTYELVPAGNYTVGEVDDQGHLKSTDPTTGKVIEGDKNVTYVYKLKETPAEPKKGEVIITYVDENGKEIEKPRQDTPNSPYDTPYNTTEEGEKPNTIKTPDGKTYKIVPKGDYPVGKVDEDGHLETSDPIKGKVDKPKSIITYVYKEVKETPAEPKGNVYVHYVDTEGKTIKSDVTDEEAQPVDKDYDTVVDNRPQEIEFEGKTYELVPAGNYTVGEVDDQGHLKSTDPTTGKVIEGDKNVTYVYKLKEIPAEPKKGEVIITYVDENGKEIEKPRQDTPNSPYDTPYNTTEEGEKPNTIKTPDGKTYKIVPKGDYPVGKVDEDGHLESSDPVKGKVDKPKSTITYVYKEVKETPAEPKGNVYVHYVDTEGKTIKEDVTDEKAQPVDKDYDTVVDNRPQEIEFEGKTYELVPAGNYTVGEVDKEGHLKSTDPTTGKVIEGDKNVTYVYKLKETPDKPVEPTPDKPVEPTPDKPVEPTPDKPVEPTPDKPVEPTPDKPVEPTPDKPVEPTPDKPVEPTPDKPVEPTPDKPVEPTPDKPVEPTPDKPVEPTPDKPVEPTPDKPVNPTPDKPVDPTPGKPVDPTPGKPVDPTPGKPVDPTPGKPVNPTPGKPVDPTSGKPVESTPAKEQLPNTGETTSVGSTVLGLVAGLVGLAALGRRKEEDEK
ncbi:MULTISPECIES: accessory Sec-dependent serine-rich glycoprotein adhesin [Streptococcus]|uniref:Putative muramidase-released protein n=1 Tax=Streptococcus viridans TaxID=78535 RepID=A0A3S4LAY5_9STRE|nr:MULTISPECIES: accessory Sec-dependent serine-rich glycoprotein adhesin [Streptococcus]VED67628.1 putative muramidase-released protein [Streptococcus viridans]VEE19392.1 putative muramidase-released protein [Streptococcus australis]